MATARGVLAKTLGIFAGITKKDLKLADAPEPTTDGTVISVPFDSEHAYAFLEKELSRVVFHSDALVREAFTTEYVAKMMVLAKRHTVALHETNVTYLVGGLFDILEAHRVMTLWSRLYPGSAAQLREIQRATVDTAITTAKAPSSVLGGLLALAHGVDYDFGELETFRPYLEEALAKVAGRSEQATLLVSRWLVSALVNQLIRDALGLPPPSRNPGSGKGQGKGTGGKGTNRGSEGRGDAGSGSQAPPSETEDSSEPNADSDPTPPPPRDDTGADPTPEPSASNPSDTESSQDTNTSEESPRSQAPGSSSSRDRPAPWNPPPVQSLPREKLQALNDLANHKAGSLPDSARSTVEDVRRPPMSSPEAQDRAEQKAQDVGKINTNDPAQLDAKLDETSEDAEKTIEALEKALQSQITEDDWLTQESPDTVVVQDVRATDLPLASLAGQTVLSDADEQAVKHLRVLFGRVKGRAERALDHQGTEVDVESYIERRANRDNRPVFRADVRGRGFKCVLLIDRSGTMTGEKTAHAEHAYRVLHAALRFPFVDLRVWGFNSLDFGRTNIYRFEAGMPCFSTPKSPVGGHTPLPTAIDLAVKELRRGTEHKVLFVLSDGFPEHFNAQGQAYGRQQMMDGVRGAVVRATAAKVRVVGTFVGELERGTGSSREMTLTATVTPDKLAYMFGPPKNWRVLDPRRMGDALVSLVSDTFLEFLRG